MKKYLSIIAIFISFLSWSQVTIENGHVDLKGDFVFESITALEESFTWKVLESDSTINCFMQKGEDLVTTLVWRLGSMRAEGEVTRYLVFSSDGISYYLDFLNGGKSVIIFNTSNLQYSIMKGEGVFYALN